MGDHETSLANVAIFGTFLIFALLLGTVAVNCVKPSRLILASMQFFSAGIILAAMGYEVLPAMSEESNGVWRDLAVVIGCVAGISLMIYVKTATAANQDDAAVTNEAPLTASQEYLRMFNAAPMANGQDDVKPSIPDVEDVIPAESGGSGGDYGTSEKAPAQAGSVPWSIVLGIFFDTSMDGFLIGIVYAMSIHAAFILTIAVCMELCYLGMTMAAIIQPLSLVKRTGITLFLGTTTLLTAIIGVSLSFMLEDCPAAIDGIASFAVASLLFTVSNEMIVEAHDNQEGHTLLTVWIFLGFLMILVVEYIFEDTDVATDGFV